MNDIVKQINQIPFEQVFSKLWVKTFYCGFWTKWIYDNWKQTDGWKLNEKENLVNDFSWKRAKGDVISFIQEFLKIDFQQTLDFCKWNFNIYEEKPMDTFVKRKEFKQIEPLNTSKNIEKYLSERWINYQKLVNIVKPARSKTYWKDVQYNGECIACNMMNMKWEQTWVQYRSIDGKAFHTDGSDGLFFSLNGNKERNYIFIVEWLTDYLSIRQYSELVIWLKSCKTAIDEDFKKFLWEFKKIYLLFDNDEAGKEAKRKFKEQVQSSDIYEIEWEEKIDVNDLAIELWEETIEWIQSISILTQKKFVKDYSKILSKDEIIEFLPWKYTWWTKNLDKAFWKFNDWTYNTITWESQSGKTEFAIFMWNENAKRWKKVVFISLEMTTKDIYKRMALKKCWLPKEVVDFWLTDEQKNRANEMVKTLKNLPIKITGIDVEATLANILELIILMKLDWYEMFIIDSMDMIKVDGTDDENKRIWEITKKIKELANKENIQISIIHHFTKWSDKDRKNWDRWLWALKWSVKVENNSDLVIRVARNISDEEYNSQTDIEKKEVRISLMKDRVYWEPSTRTIYFIQWQYQDYYQ